MLPGGSLLKYSSAQEGQLSIGFAYDHEYLSSPIYGTNSIPNYNKERTDNSTTTLILNAGILPKITFSAFIPYRYVLNEKVLFRGQNDNQYEGGLYSREAYGIGDIILQMSYQLNPIKGHFPLLIGAGVKLANGKINAMDKYDDRISDNLQVGSGSVDPVFSLYTNEPIGSFMISTGVFTRISSRENIYGYKYGNELHGLTNLDYIGSDLFFGGIQLYYLLTTRDTYEYGKIARDRGGKSVFFSTKMGSKITDEFDLEIILQMPVHQNLNESQLTSSYSIQIGTLYRFSL